VIAAAPFAVLLAVAAAPLMFLLARLSSTGIIIDAASLGPTLAFAVGGAAVATIVGGAVGVLAGTREYPARRSLIALSTILIAAPPAFWWIGALRVPLAWGNITGAGTAAFVAGVALSPVAILMVGAALREMPSNIYQAARVALPATVRVKAVLLPLLASSLAGAFLLSIILLLGESELPFLFGFRTVMTDVVTTFSQTFDVERTVPLIVPLLLTILVLGIAAGRPLMRTVLTSSRGAHGVIRTPAAIMLSLCAAAPVAFLLLSLAGYGWAAIPALFVRQPVSSLKLSTALVSIAEPIAVAWIALLLAIGCAYPARLSRAMSGLLWVGLLLFCVPAAIYAIAWLRMGQLVGGVAIPGIVAHTSRAVGLAALGFAIGYARVPASLENAARLVPVSPARRALQFVLPLMVPSLAASSALIAALTYADRDVASLSLAPGASRLTLDFYLASANAPSTTVGVLAFVVLIGAAVAVTLAAAGPAVVWRRRG
jgi:iron(III) transport system permease protein